MGDHEGAVQLLCHPVQSDAGKPTRSHTWDAGEQFLPHTSFDHFLSQYSPLFSLQAKEFFEKSRLPIQELRQIWQLSDVTKVSVPFPKFT